MAKGILYALPRQAGRHEKADYARALELFQSRGEFEGNPVLVAYVVTYCFDRGIAFTWKDGAEGSTIKRARE